MRIATVATCALDQWALDFEGNAARIRASIEEAKARGARYRLGPELEIPGYGCEDHFLEHDTLRHSWETLAALLGGDLTDGILCDLGMPVAHRGVRYDARVLVLDRRILLIRPKTALADGGAYRESRWFAPWRRPRATEPFELPPLLREVTGQETVPIGDAVVAALDAAVASESGEAPFAPHLEAGLDGVEVFANGAASHHVPGGPERRLERVRAATEGSGGIWLYANGRGCDGGRLLYDGGAMIVANGEVVAQGARFAPAEVEVVTAAVDLDAVRARRAAVPDRMRRAAEAAPFPRVRAPLALAAAGIGAAPDPARPLRIRPPEEALALGPALWLWDYLRRSGARGFFLALSGGSDSAAVAVIVGAMCRLVLRAVEAGDAGTEAELARVLGLAPGEAPPRDPRELARRLLTTAYLPSELSSAGTRERARALAAEVGARHLEAPIDGPVAALARAHDAAAGPGPRPRFRRDGGDAREDVALQNLQARTRMVLSYLLAQLDPGGARLVLGTSNADETRVGYVTKYDASAADVNPIGGISKGELRALLRWARGELGYAALDAILDAAPSAELAPPGEAGPQTDERDLGLTYDELARLGRLREVERCGPLEAFERLAAEEPGVPPRRIAERVRRFFRAYARNRHKATVLTPAPHVAAHGVDDARSDPRPFLLDPGWERQFAAIEARVAALEEARA